MKCSLCLEGRRRVEVKTTSEWNEMVDIYGTISSFWIGYVLIISVLDFFSCHDIQTHTSVDYSSLVSSLIPWGLCSLSAAHFRPWLLGGPDYSLILLLSICLYNWLVLVRLCRGPYLSRVLQQQTSGWLVEHFFTLHSQSLRHLRLDLFTQWFVKLRRGILNRNPSGHKRRWQHSCNNSCHP